MTLSTDRLGLPWSEGEVWEDAIRDCDGNTRIQREDYEPSTVWLDKDDMRVIVRAVNAHEEAVAIIKALDEHLTEYGEQVGPLTQALWDRACKLLASLD